MESDKPARSDASVWSRRLEGNDHFSCSTDWGPGEVLKYFWQDVFGQARPGSRVLEIGCGAGQVSFWGVEAGRGLKIVASDKISAPGGTRFQHSDVTFMGQVAAERLPFAADSFELVVSNFAIEYAPLHAALAEAARVLTPRGSLILVLHSSDSIITGNSRLGISINDALTGVRVPEYVRDAARLPPADPARRSLLESVCARKAQFPQPPISYTGVEYFDFAERLLSDAPPGLTDLDALDQAVSLRRDVFTEQSRVALDVPALRRMEEHLTQLGLAGFTSEITCTYDALHTDKVGWIGVFSKPPAGV